MNIISYTPDQNGNISDVSCRYRDDSHYKIRITNNIGSIGVLRVNDNIRSQILNMNVSDSIKIISENCLKGGQNLKTVSGCANVNTISSDAFNGCTQMKMLNDMLKVTRIGNNAFYDCQSIEKTPLLNNGEVTFIGDNAFHGCIGLKTVDVVLNGTSTNGIGIFSGCTSLTDVHIGNGFTIKQNTFNGDNKLTSLTIDESYGGLEGQQSLGNMTSLTEITIPSSTTALTEKCFYGDTSLKKINFVNENSRLTNIGSHCFQGCANLTELILPQSINNISHFNVECLAGSNVASVTLRGITSQYMLERKQNFTNFGRGDNEISYISQDGKKFKADRNGLKQLGTKAIICINANNSGIGEGDDSRWHSAFIIHDLILEQNPDMEESDVYILTNHVDKGWLNQSKFKDKNIMPPATKNIISIFNDIGTNYPDSDIIFHFEDHGGKSYMVMSDRGFSNTQFWECLNKTSGNKFCFIACCHAGIHAENAESQGGVKNFLMYCACRPNKLSERHFFKDPKCDICSYFKDDGRPKDGGKHVINDMTNAVINNWDSFKNLTFDQSQSKLGETYAGPYADLYVVKSSDWSKGGNKFLTLG